MTKPIDLTGKRFGKWVVLFQDGKRNRNLIWMCKCDCGTERKVPAARLNFGRSRSCGCVWLKHGKHGTVEYKNWRGILGRCCNKRNKDYHRYGGIKITVCKRWRTSFANFLADMGQRPTPKHQIDRIDGKQGYSPENCRWATAKEQARNRHNNRFVNFHGEQITIAEAAERIGVSRQCLRYRIEAGWPERFLFRVPDRGSAVIEHSHSRKEK